MQIAACNYHFPSAGLTPQFGCYAYTVILHSPNKFS